MAFFLLTLIGRSREYPPEVAVRSITFALGKPVVHFVVPSELSALPS